MSTSATCSAGTMTCSTASPTSRQDIKKGLEKMFGSITKVNKLFVVDGVNIGVIFNPKKEKIKFGEESTFYSQVILVFHEDTPDKVVNKIKEVIPQKYTISKLCLDGTTKIRIIFTD